MLESKTVQIENISTKMQKADVLRVLHAHYALTIIDLFAIAELHLCIIYCDSIDHAVLLDEGQWHRLDNSGSLLRVFEAFT
jgi:hypothetical protein